MSDRHAQLADIAARLGLWFTVVNTEADLGGWRSLPICRREQFQALNLLSGEMSGLPVQILDCRYRSSRARNARRLSQTVVLLPWDAGDLPAFELGPRTLRTRVMSFFGIEGVSLSADEAHRDEGRVIAEFLEHYHLYAGWEAEARMLATGASAAYASHDATLRHLFSQEVLRFLADRPGRSIEGLSRCLALWRPGGLIEPDETSRLVSEAVAIREVLLQSALRSVPAVAVAPTERPRLETVTARVLGSGIGLSGGFFAGLLLGFALAVFRESPPGRSAGLVFLACPLVGLVLGALVGRFLLALPIEWSLRRRRSRARATAPDQEGLSRAEQI